MESFDTPILFIIYNRPNITKKVFEHIKQLKPKALFIAADGPSSNRPKDPQDCMEARNIASTIDWDCNLQTLFQPENLGCGNAVSGAINWFFSIVDRGIILEDDCMPHPEFFQFCEVFLNKYQDDKEIMMISGANFQPPNTQGNHFAYLSRIPHIWGWATWRRAWQNYDFNLNELPAALLSNKWKTFHQDMEICYYWFRIFIQCWLRKIDTRDYQWVFAIMNNKGLCIAPGINLVRNIGINENSTHTKGGFAPNIPDEFYIQKWKLMGEKEVSEQPKFDNYTLNKILNAKFQNNKNIFSRIRKKIKRRIDVISKIKMIKKNDL
jgi:hypothetical protein